LPQKEQKSRLAFGFAATNLHPRTMGELLFVKVSLTIDRAMILSSKA